MSDKEQHGAAGKDRPSQLKWVDRFIDCCSMGHRAQAGKMLAKYAPGFAAGVANSSGVTPLMAAARAGYADMAAGLVDLCDAKAVDKTGRDAMMHLASGGNNGSHGSKNTEQRAIVEMLWGRADPKKICAAGFDALEYAAFWDTVAVAEALLELGVGDPVGAMKIAMGNCSDLSVQALARHVDLEERDELGRTWLLRAAMTSYGCLMGVMGLSDCGASDHSGSDALMLAARLGNARSVEALLPHCDPMRVGSDGRDALMEACAIGAGQCVFLLMEHSDLFRVDSLGLGTLDHARNCGSVAIVDRLKELMLAQSEKEILGEAGGRQSLGGKTGRHGL